MKRLGLAAAVLLAAAPLAAQKPPAQDQKPFPPVSERVEVSVTNVEVVVTDSKGNRVAGLTRDEFEVYQDGTPQKISNFYAVAGGKVLLDDGKVVGLDSPEAKIELPAELKARYILFIDNLNIQPQNRNRMFKSLEEFVKGTIGSRAEGMVVSFNRSLKVRRKFTSEASEIIATLDEIEHETGGGTTLVSERRDALHQIDESQSADSALQIARSYARSLRNDLEFTVDALKNTMNSLAGVEGRKVLVYVSEGLPATAGAELYDQIQRKFQNQGGGASLEQFEFDMSSRYTGIIRAANAHGVTLWPLDASGLTTDTLISAENRGFDTRPSDFGMRMNTQSPLRLMAEETGGVAAVNTNDWKKNLDELSKDFSNFYSIGYRSSRSAVDKPHSFEVRVKRKGLTVRSRKGFLEKTIETRTAESVLASLFYPRDDNPLAVSVSLGAQQPYDRENFSVPVRVSVPIGKLGLVPVGDHYEATFFVYVVARDSAEKQSELAVQRQVVTVPTKDLDKAQHKDWYYDFTMTVSPGAQRISFAVRDGISNLVSFYQKNLFVSLLPKETKAKS
ncbi:MAG TPA: VWA domain-containing protein [Thermoanaerobaculia bacterium]|nr:VWA domain-containing protein [Thermoanaerobaculia bacterium]